MKVQSGHTYVLYRPYESDNTLQYDVVTPEFDEDQKLVGWHSLVNSTVSPVFEDDEISCLPAFHPLEL